MSYLSSVASLTSLSTTKFTKAQVYYLIKNFVYPPCSKDPDDIRRFHKLVDDLGYVDNTRSILAGKTNNVFNLNSPEKFSGSELMAIDVVGKHIDATIAKLKALGRLA
ncbi:hypothetical protein [Candidatus Thiosymbion oneisti]|uniref:hypothetical protein n=1 Tax=Candidatus Thiosymbion oneisti TaxID=589554 RepID=UPI000B7F7112|nr:hypothetical protein [Candidatus Thiosymbion oneisti]